MKTTFAPLLAMAALQLALFTGLNVQASEPQPQPLSHEQVAALAATCHACHGPDGRSQVGIPPLAGNPEAVLRAQLLAFRGDEIPGATVMPRLMRGFTEAELEALAAWFAGLDREETTGGDQP